MRKSFFYIVFVGLILTICCLSAEAQDDFRWPREKAYEIAGGASVSGIQMQAGFVRFFQPKKMTEVHASRRYNLLTGRDKYMAFPCKRKPAYKIPPGLSAKASVFYELGSGKGYRYQVAGIEASLMYIVLHKRDLYISLKGGATSSYNRLLTPVNEGTPNYYARFKFGVVGGVEIERMIDRRKTKSVVLGWQEYRLIKDDSWGTTRWYAFVALRYKINKKE